MMKFFIDNKYLILIWMLLLFVVGLTFAHHGSVIIDCGREAYYPAQMLKGQVLYKDILNIYGPFSYMFNALLFKLFGINLKVLYLSGVVCAFIISTLIYKISRYFLTDFESFSIAVFTVLTGTATAYLSNFIFPYSFGMLYGITAFLCSFIFLLKFCEGLASRYFYFACFFAVIAVLNKYEFIPFLVVLLYVAIRFKFNIKQHCLSLFSFSSIALLCFSILAFQGLRITHMIAILSIIQKMSTTHTFEYFYKVLGIYYYKPIFVYAIISTAVSVAVITIFSAAFKPKNTVLKLFLISFAIVLIFMTSNPLSFALLMPILLILSMLNMRNIKSELTLQFLVLSSISIGLKSLFVLNIGHYGLFFAGFLFITVFALLKAKFSNLKGSCLAGYLIIFSLALAFKNIPTLASSVKLSSPRGFIYSDKYTVASTIQLIDFIANNTKPSDKILILPEGALVNFLTNRDSDNVFTSLIPLYFETFGEQNIISKISGTKPEYIVFNNWNTKDYYFEYICKDYAGEFCSFVYANYRKVKIINNGLEYVIFKRNEY